MRRCSSLFFIICVGVASAQELTPRPEGPVPIKVAPAKPPNSDATYVALRNITVGKESSVANNLVLQRDTAKFTFQSGNFYFLAPVNGKVTGAAFVGNGTFEMTPPIDSEVHSLAFLTREPGIHEEFQTLLLRFTDNTYDGIKEPAEE